MLNYNHRTHYLIITFFVFTILLVCCTPGYDGLGLFIIYIYFLIKYSPSYTYLGMLKSELSIYQFLSHLGVSFVQIYDVYIEMTHLLSIEGADWPKLHDMFKTRDAKTWQRKFPEGFPVGVYALKLLFINIFMMIFVGMDFSRAKSNELTD